MRKAYKPWKHCIHLDERNVDGQYLPLAWPEAGGEHVTGSSTPHVDPKIVMAGLDIVTPRGEAIVSNLDLTVTQDNAVMVTGCAYLPSPPKRTSCLPESFRERACPEPVLANHPSRFTTATHESSNKRREHRLVSGVWCVWPSLWYWQAQRHG